MKISTEFKLKKSDIKRGFRLRMEKAIATTKEISDPEKRKLVENGIRENVKLFKMLYEDDLFSVQETFDAARSIADVVDSSVTAGRYGHGSPEMEKLIERLSEQQEQELENRMWEEQMEERMRLERSSKARSKR